MRSRDLGPSSDHTALMPPLACSPSAARRLTHWPSRLMTPRSRPPRPAGRGLWRGRARTLRPPPPPPPRPDPARTRARSLSFDRRYGLDASLQRARTTSPDDDKPLAPTLERNHAPVCTCVCHGTPRALLTSADAPTYLSHHSTVSHRCPDISQCPSPCRLRPTRPPYPVPPAPCPYTPARRLFPSLPLPGPPRPAPPGPARPTYITPSCPAPAHTARLARPTIT